MNFADQLNSIGSIDEQQAKLDRIAIILIGEIKNACHISAREGGHSISGFVDSDSYDGTMYRVPAAGYLECYGTPAERHNILKKSKRKMHTRVPDLTLPKSTTIPRKGLVHNLNSNEIAYIIRKIENFLISDGLTVSISVVAFHDLQQHSQTVFNTIIQSVSDLPTTYPNILFNVSW